MAEEQEGRPLDGARASFAAAANPTFCVQSPDERSGIAVATRGVGSSAEPLSRTSTDSEGYSCAARLSSASSSHGPGVTRHEDRDHRRSDFRGHLVRSGRLRGFRFGRIGVRVPLLDAFAPSMRAVPGLRESWARYERFAASPGVARAMVENLLKLDVRHVLPAIHVPTLVISHADVTAFGPPFGRYIAEHVEGARFVELPGIDNLMWAGDQAAVVAEIASFVTGATPVHPSDRRLATVLFTDIVGSTKHAAEVGDRAWRELLDHHDASSVRPSSAPAAAWSRRPATASSPPSTGLVAPSRPRARSRRARRPRPPPSGRPARGGDRDHGRRRRWAGRARRGPRLRARRP